MYIQIFILMKAAFFRGNSKIQFNHTNTGQTEEDRYFDETNEKSGNYRK